VIGTYAVVLAVCGASLALGQAAIAACGCREWSWLSPAIGLALLCAICWGTVRLPGNGAFSAVAVLFLTVAAVCFLWKRLDGGGVALRIGLPVALITLIAVSLPFAVEGHFGILGTRFNPDMSQHLLAADRLAHGSGSQLLHQGYPLGPHAIVVALNKGLGVCLVQGFSGLTIAVSILAALTALTAFSGLPPLRRAAGALLVGVPYMVASYFAQGAFKETMQALFVLAFALSLREASCNSAWRGLPLRFVPSALLAVGSVYAYSFPGLIWFVGIAVIWAFAELAWGKPPAARPVFLAALLFFVLIAPELGRMIEFHSFETFNPSGPGLGNLFGQVSPFEALGIWPSGDFRLAPGDGAVPAVGYYLGAAFAAALLIHGLIRCWRRREAAVIAGLVAAAGVYAAARIGGTPYTAAKATAIVAPLCVLIILLPLLEDTGKWRFSSGMRMKSANKGALFAAASGAYLLAAGGCALLALANAPVGPTSYSPALAELRPLVASGSTVILASHELLDDQHGTPYLAWELRGGRVCIEPDDTAGGGPPPGVRFVIAEGSPGNPPFTGLRVRRVDPPFVLWERAGPVRGRSDCPLVAVRQARQGPAR
jgi:hypothetical protein